MATKTHNRTNFHCHTFCVFEEVNTAVIANLILDYKSKSGSSYYFTDTGVYRLSNHWGRAANCKWRLISKEVANSSRTRLGFALWTSFHEDNDNEKLYFIAVDFENRVVTYHHKNSADDIPGGTLRTAAETTKIIKDIRHLLTTESWAKYYKLPIVALRATIIGKLITENLSLTDIKRELLHS